MAVARDTGRPLPVDHPEGENRVASQQVVRVSLTEEETKALLTEVPAAYHTQINDVLRRYMDEHQASEVDPVAALRQATRLINTAAGQIEKKRSA